MVRACRFYTVVALLVLTAGGIAHGSGAVIWQGEMGVPLSGASLNLYGSTTISGQYSIQTGSLVSGEVYLPFSGSGGTLSAHASHESDLVINWPVGTWSLLGDASFALQTPSLLGFSSEATLTAYGTSTTAAFSLHPFLGAYATVLSIELAGPTQSGWGLTGTVDLGDPWGTSCNLDFTGLSIGLEAFPWGCVHTDVAIEFSAAGYENTSIAIDIELWDGVFALVGSLNFGMQTKSLSLTPYLTVGEQCIWLSVGIYPQEIGPGTSSAIDTLVIQGIGITDCEIGPITFSAISGLGGGLYRSSKASDIDLHANGYYVALAPDANPWAWTQTDYCTVITIQRDDITFLDSFTSSRFTLDLYFDPSASTLFDFALLTAEWEHEMSEAFSYRIAVQVDPTGADPRIEFGFTASAVLP